MGMIVFGETTFLIANPAPLTTVRETFYVSIPKSSFPQGAYVGFWGNGKFIGAPAPSVVGRMNVYPIHTKHPKIPDGKLKLETVLFLETSKRSRALKKVSIDLVVGNHAGIFIPENGFNLHYAFKKNTPLVYEYKEYIGPENKGEKSLSPINLIRLLYSIENTYSDFCKPKEALIRLSVLPKIGKKEIQTRKDFALQAAQNDPRSEVLPFYLRMNAYGQEIFGTPAPLITYSPEHKTQLGTKVNEGILNPELWPILPEKNVKVGESWNGNLQALDLKKFQEPYPSHLVKMVPAKVKFENVEWELGEPCAKLSYEASPTVEGLQAFLERLPRVVQEFSTFKAEKMTFNMWLSLSSRKIIRMDRILVGKLNSVAPKTAASKISLLPSPPRPGGFSPLESGSTYSISLSNSGPVILHSMMVLLKKECL